MGLGTSSSSAALPPEAAVRSAEVPRRKLMDAGRPLRFTRRTSCPPGTELSSSSGFNCEVEHSLQLTADDKYRIRSTWPVLSRYPCDVGEQVFIRIFQLAPDSRKAFRFDGMPDSELTNNEMFRIHASRFIRAVDLAVNNLDASTLSSLVLSTSSGFPPMYGWGS